MTEVRMEQYMLWGITEEIQITHSEMDKHNSKQL
jgi:hypothetical protein